jgi:hypothetical protein
MKRNGTLLFFSLLFFGTTLLAQPYYLRGSYGACDWGNSAPGCELTDPDTDGIYTLDIDLGGVGNRQEFKIYDAGADAWYPPFSNAWYIHSGGNITFRFNPANGEVEASDGLSTGICAPGEFSGWNNAAPMTNTIGNTWCYTVPTAGCYQWKPTACGSWDSWQPGTGERSTNSANWQVTTTVDNQQFCVDYNPTTGRVTATGAQDGYFLRGSHGAPCDWSNSSCDCDLEDPDGDGVYELTFDFGATPLGLQEFKIFHSGTGTWYPSGNNSWYNHQGGAVTFRFDTNTGTVQSADNYSPSICAPGAFSGWNNAAAMQQVGPGIFCYAVPTPGTYEWKPTVCGSWDSWQPGTGERNKNASNWSATTTTADQKICVSYDASTGLVSGAAFTPNPIPTMGEWGMIVLGLLTMIIGIIAIRQRKLAMAGVKDSNISISNLPFNKASFAKMLWMVAGFFVMTFIVAITIFGYEMTSADIPGSLISIPLVAYLATLIKE